MTSLPQTGQTVKVISLSDNEADPQYWGRLGVVTHIDFDCGCGQSPGDGMVGVLFSNGKNEEYWKEEIQ